MEKALFSFYQAAEQERSTFVSYLLPLLSEYSLHPQISDSQSIVSNVKVSSEILSYISCINRFVWTSDLFDIFKNCLVLVVALYFGG